MFISMYRRNTSYTVATNQTHICPHHMFACVNEKSYVVMCMLDSNHVCKMCSVFVCEVGVQGSEIQINVFVHMYFLPPLTNI